MNVNFLLESELKHLSDSMLLTNESYEEPNIRYRSEKRIRQFSENKFDKPIREANI